MYIIEVDEEHERNFKYITLLNRYEYEICETRLGRSWIFLMENLLETVTKLYSS